MRILLLTNLYPPHSEGGAEVLAGDIVSKLELDGHVVHVLTSSFGVGHPSVDGRVMRTLRLAPSVHFDGRRAIWRQLLLPLHYLQRYHAPANAAEIRRVVAEQRPDVLYVWETAGIGVTSILHAFAHLTIPIVLHLGSYWLLYARSPQTAQSRLRLRMLKRWLIGSIPTVACTSFVAVSEHLKQEYVRAGFDGARIEVIYNGLSPRFLSAPVPERPAARKMESIARLLFVGRLCREKGALTLVKALDLLVHGHDEGADTRPHLTIVGDGDPVYLNELRSMVAERRLDACITLRGRLAQSDLVTCYDEADIMVVPSLWDEPFGLVVIEAMSRGLPVIASRVGGLVEIITPDVTGILTEPGNERAIAEVIADLMANPRKRQRLGEAGCSMVRERFSIEHNATQVAAHLERALHTPNLVLENGH